MTNNVWFSSDHHFDHANILKFVNYDGNKVRPEFSSVEEMNEAMIERHNQKVAQQDKWYCLGDIGFNKTSLEQILPRLNGKKRLILGNHDEFNMSFYEKYFEKIMVTWRPDKWVIFSHYPLFLGPQEPKIKLNVHGHIHRGQIDDKRYYNISVEETNYSPISYEDIISEAKRRRIKYD